MNIAAYIDHTILKPNTTLEEVEQCCIEAVEYGFAAVCIPPPFVKRVATILAPTHIKVATVVGFPFGYSATEAKIAESILAVVDGVHEVDMVINLIALRMKDWEFLKKEVGMVTQLLHNKGKILKLIIESGILTDEEIVECCTRLGTLGIDFMKTSTGYAEKSATVDAVRLMRKHLPSTVKIKASGGIRSYSFAKELIDAGAERLGCSASVSIVKASLA